MARTFTSNSVNERLSMRGVLNSKPVTLDICLNSGDCFELIVHAVNTDAARISLYANPRDYGVAVGEFYFQSLSDSEDGWAGAGALVKYFMESHIEQVGFFYRSKLIAWHQSCLSGSGERHEARYGFKGAEPARFDRKVHMRYVPYMDFDTGHLAEWLAQL